MLYGATLVLDQSPFDRNQLSAAATRGRTIFSTLAAAGGGSCFFCHGEPLLSSAPVRAGQDFEEFATLTLPDGGTSPALADAGFFNIGVRPAAEDLGLGGEDTHGGPLSFARREADAGERVAVDGAFKAPILRNVALTPPYVHNGGFATLRQVLEHYIRGGSHRDAGPGFTGDDSGTGLLGQSAIPVEGDDKGTNAGVRSGSWT